HLAQPLLFLGTNPRCRGINQNPYLPRYSTSLAFYSRGLDQNSRVPRQLAPNKLSRTDSFCRKPKRICGESNPRLPHSNDIYGPLDHRGAATGMGNDNTSRQTWTCK
ncbi:unnamed protein product, partial [Sphacelaria rigidula]